MNWFLSQALPKKSVAVYISDESEEECEVESKSKESPVSDRLMRIRRKQIKYVISDEEDESHSDDWQQISDGSDSDF